MPPMYTTKKLPPPGRNSESASDSNEVEVNNV